MNTFQTSFTIDLLRLFALNSSITSQNSLKPRLLFNNILSRKFLAHHFFINKNCIGWRKKNIKKKEKYTEGVPEIEFAALPTVVLFMYVLVSSQTNCEKPFRCYLKLE